MLVELSELQSAKAALEKERDTIVAEIHQLRQRAKQKSLEASATRTPLAETEIAFWRDGIAACQRRLMEVQGRLGEINKALRTAMPPRESPAVPVTRIEPSTLRGPSSQFYEFFHQIAKDSLDPRQFATLEKDARQLAADYRRMNNSETIR
jgi:hypothetical protein